MEVTKDTASTLSIDERVQRYMVKIKEWMENEDNNFLSDERRKVSFSQKVGLHDIKFTVAIFRYGPIRNFGRIEFTVNSTNPVYICGQKVVLFRYELEPEDISTVLNICTYMLPAVLNRDVGFIHTNRQKLEKEGFSF